MELLSQSPSSDIFIFTLFSDNNLHSSLCVGLVSQAGLQTGMEHFEQGRIGGRIGARHVGHTGHVTSPGPVRAGLSIRIVSRGRIARVATRPRPRPGIK